MTTSSKASWTVAILSAAALAACVVDGSASHQASLDRASDEQRPHCGVPSASVPADEQTVYYQENYDFIVNGDPLESAEGAAVTTEQEFLLFPREIDAEAIADLEPVAATVSCTKTCGPGAGRCRARGCLPMLATGECSECTCYNPWVPNDVCPECTCTATVTASTDAAKTGAGN